MFSPGKPPELHPQNHKPYGISADQRRTLIAAVGEGNFFTTACRIAGVNYDTFCDWMVKGGDPLRDDKGKPAPGEEVEPYKSFMIEIRQAEALAEHKALKALNHGASVDWRAAAWLLSRRHNTNWAEKPQGVQVNTTGTVQFFLPDNQRDPLTEGNTPS